MRLFSVLEETRAMLRDQYAKAKKPNHKLKLAVWLEMVELEINSHPDVPKLCRTCRSYVCLCEQSTG